MRSGAREQFSLVSPADFWIICSTFFRRWGGSQDENSTRIPRTRLRFGRWSANPVLPRFFSRPRQRTGDRLGASSAAQRANPTRSDWPVVREQKNVFLEGAGTQDSIQLRPDQIRGVFRIQVQSGPRPWGYSRPKVGEDRVDFAFWKSPKWPRAPIASAHVDA